MAYITVNSDGFMNDVDAFVDDCVHTYKEYLHELLCAKRVEELSMNEMAFIRLVSSSSILSMKKSGNSMLEILRKPVNKPCIAKSKPVNAQSAMDFIKSLPADKQAEFLAMLQASRNG